MGVRILVADDDEHIRNLLAEFMRKNGYQHDMAESVNSALSFIQNNDYDMILTDKNMPDMEGNPEGGMTLLKYAKEHMPSTEIIMITGHATMETAIEAIKLGAFDFIMKPFSLNDLEEKIKRVLEYRGFVNSGDTIQMYRTFHNQLLKVLENRDDLPEDQLRQMLRVLGARIDNVFGTRKYYETIIHSQSEALEKIAGYIELLKDAFPKQSRYKTVVEKIWEESKKRI
ncbi:MAG: response regulator [Thermodesulfobacteriota bacterium]|nr:response regulator [Thermodesulfobacteriota bacterium]